MQLSDDERRPQVQEAIIASSRDRLERGDPRSPKNPHGSENLKDLSPGQISA